jgi:hypothetical protein
VTEREAQEIIRMVESNWSFDLGDARALWRDALVRYDAELATQAVARLARTRLRGRRPDLPDLLELIEMNAPSLPPVTRCPTCKGDKMVECSDGYAPCPDCNPNANPDFVRGQDGTRFVGLKGEAVRERMIQR